ncbi:MAG: RNA methyltransferase, partial [Spirochaetaceae bacterium]|nr:RNA methyltransferase [Spirochaetaceae bacterium]
MKHKRIPISKSNATYQILQSIKENRKKRRQHNEILVEGIESIKQLFQSSFEVKRILFKDYESLSQWAKDRILEYPRSELLELSPELYHNLADKEEPAEIMVTTVFPVTDLSQISLTSNPLILILDRPGNYGNLGSILRSANSFAVDLVLITGHGVDPWDPRVIRSSLGAIFYTPLIPLESHQ